MAQIIVTMPDEAHALLVASFAGHFGYQATLPDGEPNPLSAEKFAQEQVVAYCRAVIKEYQRNLLAVRAKEDLDRQVDGIVIGVDTQAVSPS